MRIDQVIIDRLSVPLSSPYELALGTVNDLDIVLVQMLNDGKERGYGEAATLEGYFNVETDTVWEESKTAVDAIVGQTTSEAAKKLSTEPTSLLTQSAFNAALTDLSRDGYPSLRVPVVGIASANGGVDTTVESISNQVERGHDVVKIKIGFDVTTDAKVLEKATAEVPNHVSFRVDANQGYSVTDVRQFLTKTDTSQLALFEQPLPVGNIESHASLRSEMDVPLMLDEEIRGKDTLRTIIDADAADMVKFKMMKQGGPGAVRSLTTLARDAGLDVVLGNGVQSDVGCLQEASLWEALDIDTVGEFNGWHKQDRSVLTQTPQLNEGQLSWNEGEIQHDEAIVDAYSEARYTVSD